MPSAARERVWTTAERCRAVLAIVVCGAVIALAVADIDHSLSALGVRTLFTSTPGASLAAPAAGCASPPADVWASTQSASR